MTVTEQAKNSIKFIELASGGGLVGSERDALDLVGACGEHGTRLLLIDASCLPEEFFRLRTGLAGAVLQKFVNYGLKVAAYTPPNMSNQGKFMDFKLETNRGNHFRLLESKEDAIDWLIS
jgi:hypothetical protein